MFQEIGKYLSSQGLAIVLILLLLVINNDEKAMARLTGKMKKGLNFAIIIYYLFIAYEVFLIIEKNIKNE